MTKQTKLLYLDAFRCLVVSLVLIGIASLILVNLSIFSPFTSAFKDFSFLDLFYTEKMGKEHPVNTDIVLVNIEHKDRFEIAQLLEKLQQQHPIVIGIDVLFKEKKDAFMDSVLAVQLKKPNIVNSHLFLEDSLQNNHSIFVNTLAESGYSNLNFTKNNKVIRTIEASKKHKERIQYNFAATIAKKVLDEKRFETISTKLKNEIQLKYYGNLDHFLHFGYHEVMQADSIPAVKDKIILLGYLGVPINNEFDVEDKHFTPLNKNPVGRGIPDMYGVVIHANTLQMILTNDFIYNVPIVLIAIITLLVSFILLVYFLKLTKIKAIRAMFVKKAVQLVFTVVFLYIALYLLTFNIHLKATPIIAIALLCVGGIPIYVILINYLHKKYKWKSYLHS